MFMSMKLDKRLFPKTEKTGNRTLTMKPYYREESKKHRRLKLVKRHINRIDIQKDGTYNKFEMNEMALSGLERSR